MGLWKPSKGTIDFDARNIAGWTTPAIAREGIGYVPESMGIFSGLSVRENVVLAARTGPPDGTRLQWIFQLFPALKKFWNLPAGHLSGGQKQMLAVSRAIIEPKKLLLIDEPTKGLAPSIVTHMMEAFRELKRNETTILLVEQNFHFARSVGDSVAVMDSGRIVHAGSMGELAADESLQQKLLGLSLEMHQ
jgi:branched-chain amino acid transport system ATP-binding protein